ncbi:hypothetical protein C8Q80DRAFT_1140035 [Daedaleopsis nitida]|nr:hypothetical protein C8Q80DRAFT_1140035 [Daedaleopsis nitida]
MLGRLFALFCSCHFVIHCHAGQAFDWTIPDAVPETPLQECGTYNITLSRVNVTNKEIGTPPYYMMVIALPNAVSTVSHIGDDSSNLSWQVQNRRGGRLLLTVFDSNGQTGGFPNTFYNVVAGQTQCLPPMLPDLPVITANVTTTVNTCDPWGLFITGGVKPYNITLATPTSPSMTNVTMGPDDNFYSYINRASPGT